MIRGNIAIPDKDPKSWRAKGRKRKPQPAIASAIVTPVFPDPSGRRSVQIAGQDLGGPIMNSQGGNLSLSRHSKPAMQNCCGVGQTMC